MKILQLIVASAICTAFISPVWADNDKNKGHGQGHGQGQDNDNDRGHAGRVEGRTVIQTPTAIVVTDRDRNTIHTYYRTEFVSGNCPPGLAKKDNGCLPPGQAQRLWNVGQPLPPTVVYYALPPPLMTQLAAPPMGYEYVRVDDDVLLMDRNTRLVSQIIANLGRLMN
jgi:Ni/Co efflux regulator RcnB